MTTDHTPDHTVSGPLDTEVSGEPAVPEGLTTPEHSQASASTEVPEGATVHDRAASLESPAAPERSAVPEHSTAPGPAALPTRTGPIVWGALILVFCAYVAVRTAGGSIDVITWLIATIIGLGLLLLGVGIAVLLRGRRGRQ